MEARIMQKRVVKVGVAQAGMEAEPQVLMEVVFFPVIRMHQAVVVVVPISPKDWVVHLSAITTGMQEEQEITRELVVKLLLIGDFYVGCYIYDVRLNYRLETLFMIRLA